MKSLIATPLLVLFLISIFSTFYDGGSLSEGNLFMPASGEGAFWRDFDSRPVAYANFTAYDEPGYVTKILWGVHRWNNATGQYTIVLDEVGAVPTFHFGFVTTGILGFLGIVSGLIVLSTLVGLRLIGSGMSEFSISTLMKGAGYLSLFLLVSANSASLIWSIPNFGWVLYMIITLVYTLGIIGSMGTVGGNIQGGD